MSNYYPPTAFSFAVRIIGTGAEVIDGAFHEVSGLDGERQVRELEKGGENRFVHKLPGSIKHSNLILKRGQLAHKSRLFAWCQQTLEGSLTQKIEPQDISISLLDQRGTRVLSLIFTGARPVKWSIERLSRSGDTIAIETLEFAYATLSRKVHRELS
jgi:phage tail-like protein